MDVNGDGVVSIEEFIDCCKKVSFLIFGSKKFIIISSFSIRHISLAENKISRTNLKKKTMRHNYHDIRSSKKETEGIGL